MYTVYKVTNVINGKYYIGVHKTDNPHDSYMGSGKAIKDALKKYGTENFIKSIILLTEDHDQAYELEKALTACFVEDSNYNMKLGGVGGFSKENSRKGHVARSRKGGIATKAKGYSFGGEHKDAVQNGRKGGLANKGKPKSQAHIQAIKDAWRRKKLEA